MQGAAIIMLLIRHLRTPGQPHDLALIVIDWFQYISGVSYPILQVTGTHLPQLEGIWIPSLRGYLQHIRGSLRIANLTMFSTARVHDSFLMDIAINSGLFTDAEICRVNYCRLFLRVMTASDISTAGGTHLAPGF